MKRIFSIGEQTHGQGPVYFSWQKLFAKYLVTTGYDASLNIYDRHGEKQQQFNLAGMCIGLDWDCEGELLGIITDRSPIILLWDSSVMKLIRVDTGLRDQLTLIAWQLKSQILAVGTSKGNCLIYEHRTSRKIPILGKHTKKIQSGCWNSNNILALIGDEKVLTLNNDEGDTICEIPLKGESTHLKFGTIYGQSSSQTSSLNLNQLENCVALLSNRKSLFVCSVFNVEHQTTLHLTAVNRRFTTNNNDGDGDEESNERETTTTTTTTTTEMKIVDFVWVDEKIVVGFTNGFCSIISSNLNQFGVELNFVQLFKEEISNFSFCLKTKQFAIGSSNVVKIMDSNDLNDVKSVLTIDDENAIEWMEWSDDGQLLTLTSSSGSLHVYLTKLTIIGASFATRFAYLSSLLEITVVNGLNSLSIESIISLEIEPQLIAVGPYHVAVAMNNRVWFYSNPEMNNEQQQKQQQILLKEREYLAIIVDIRLNADFVALLFSDGKVQLHLIENESIENYLDEEQREQRESKLFSNENRITSIALSNNFFVYATESGSIEHFLLEEFTIVNVYRHLNPVKLISIDSNAIRLIIVDEQNEIFLYNSVTDSAMNLTESVNRNDSNVAAIPSPSSVKRIIWESFTDNRGIFAIFEQSKNNILIYSYLDDTIEGPKIYFIGKDRLVAGQYPLALFNGVIISQTESGKIASFLLSTHDFNRQHNEQQQQQEQQQHNEEQLLDNLIKMKRNSDAFKLCQYLNQSRAWQRFGEFALFQLDTQLAIRVFRQLNNGTGNGFVYSIEKQLRKIEERNLLAAFCSMFLKRFDLAQQLFLASGASMHALEMRSSIHDWNESLKLAKKLSPKMIPMISKEYALKLEFSADYENALHHFQQALVDDGDGDGDGQSGQSRHNSICAAGIARNEIRCGSVKRGIELAMKLNEKENLLECALILENVKLFGDAAQLYELGHDHRKAFKLYLQIKNMKKVDQLIVKLIDETKNDENDSELIELIRMYAKQKEFDGKFKDSIEALKSIEDNLNCVRIYLDKLNDPNEAMKLIRWKRARMKRKQDEEEVEECSRMIARYFQRKNDFTSAIEFLILSKCYEEAFRLASQTSQMDIFSQILIDESRKLDEDEDEDEDNEKRKRIEKDFQSIAIYYEQEKNVFMAGKFHCFSGNFRKGVKLLLLSSSSSSSSSSASQPQSSSSSSSSQNEAIELALNAAVKSQDEQTIRYLIDFLLGEIDGEPKDFKFLFRLYLKLKMFKEATKTACIIAREEQSIGNYRNARRLLFSMLRQLKQQQQEEKEEHRLKNNNNSNNNDLIESIEVNELKQMLQLIHSYLLVKNWIKLNEHRIAAQLLIRCVDNLSKFNSAHETQILTTATIECKRSKFHSKAFEFAKILLTKHEQNLDPKFRRKIEQIVRKSGGTTTTTDEETDEAENELTPCEYCDEPLNEMSLNCLNCKQQLNFCIASGQHLIHAETIQCPRCEFQANKKPFQRLIASFKLCPMCDEEVEAEELTF